MGYFSPWMGLSATGESLLSSDSCLLFESSSGVGSLGSAVSKEVSLDNESRNVDLVESRTVDRVEGFDTVREPVVLLGERRALRVLVTGRVSEFCRGVTLREEDAVLK